MHALLRGVGQIYLQKSSLAGAVLLVAIALTSWKLALFAVVGSALGALTGRLVNAGPTDIDDGLYGFNATLVALAGGVFLPMNALHLVVIATICSTLLFHFARRRKWNVFTAPFIVATLVMLQLVSTNGSPFEPLLHSAEVIARHFGQVIFLDNTWSGLACLVAVFIGSRSSAVIAFTASGLVVALGLVLPVDANAFHGGLYGFNAVLTAIALHQQRRSFIETLGGALLATLLTSLAMYAGVRSLTAPFVLVAWLGTRLPSRA